MFADNGRHMIASLFDGTVEQINYFPQDVATNRYDTWKKMETGWKNQRNAGVSVHVNIKPHFPTTTSKRPNWFEVTYEYGGVPQTVPAIPVPIVNTLPVPTNVVGSPIFIIPNP